MWRAFILIMVIFFAAYWVSINDPLREPPKPRFSLCGLAKPITRFDSEKGESEGTYLKPLQGGTYILNGTVPAVGHYRFEVRGDSIVYAVRVPSC